VPFPHGSQVSAPWLLAGLEYLPLPHQSQRLDRPTTSEAEPSAHRPQSASVVAEHTKHPGKPLYLPGPHSVHVLALPKEYPPGSHRLQFSLPFLLL